MRQVRNGRMEQAKRVLRKAAKARGISIEKELEELDRQKKEEEKLLKLEEEKRLNKVNDLCSDEGLMGGSGNVNNNNNNSMDSANDKTAPVHER